MAKDDDLIDSSKMPLLEHLIELRTRLLWSVVAIVALFMVCFYFSHHIYQFLVQPLADVFHESGRDRRMIYTALHEAFFTYVKVSFFAAMFVGFPFIACQIWLFVAPGLYRNERQAFLPFLIATPILFLIGAMLVYFLIMPLAMGFFLTMQQDGGQGRATIELLPRVSEYLGLIMTLIFAFGIMFQLPVVITLLSKAGLVSVESLKTKRKWAIVLAFIAAAVLTPPDPVSQLGLAIPTILLYEISIQAARLVEKRRMEEEARREAAEAGE